MAVDLLLANPLFLSQNDAESELMSPYFPLGLLCLAAYVRERGCGRVRAFGPGAGEGDQHGNGHRGLRIGDASAS